MTATSRPSDPVTHAPQALEHYHIEATKSLVDRPLRALKDGELFGVFNQHGGCVGDKGAPDGLFYHDTRHLSLFDLRLGGRAPLLLSSGILDNNAALTIDLTNADLHDDDGAVWLQRDSLHVGRTKFLSGNACYDRVLIRRFSDPVGFISLDLVFGSDFADLFEVRGEDRPRRGEAKVERLNDQTIRYSYLGLDQKLRTTTLRFDPSPNQLTTNTASWQLDLSDCELMQILVVTTCDEETQSVPPVKLASAYRSVRQSSRRRGAQLHTVSSSNALVNKVFHRAASDIEMLLTETEFGLYPYAGVPWYSTIFGRDGIITALQLLWTAPEIARGVLQVLARTQANDFDPAADAEPGKIVHEMRSGEMAVLGEVPFARYYGTVDATPLFVMLGGAYFSRTGDLNTLRALWTNIEAALSWLDQRCEKDKGGFLTYQRLTERGLSNQGWKDSFDAIFHADGQLAEGPIALCEVQGYLFAAKREAAKMASALGLHDRAAVLESEAERVRANFEATFWMDDLGCYALAIDGRGQPCRVLSSNAGHALFSGIASPERAARLADLFLERRFFSGWGVRTIAAGEARYNPMSYHNGSVWPHDNAMIALGLSRYGHKAAALKIFQRLIEAGTYNEFSRLPELFCGFSRRRSRGYTAYPVACSPQAWSAAAPFALMSAACGLEVDHQENCLRLQSPALPPIMEEVFLRGITVADTTLDLALRRSGNDVTTEVLRRDGSAIMMVTK
jgi:glycogen debranching enzyme